jgi:hypothetical protein
MVPAECGRDVHPTATNSAALKSAHAEKREMDKELPPRA